MTSPDVSAVRSIGSFPILAIAADALIALLRERRDAGQPVELLYANTHFIGACVDLASELRGPRTLIVNDGVGLDIVSWLLYRNTFPENLNGTDFTPRFLRSVDRATRVFLLGATPAAVAGTARRWALMPSIEVVGAVDGFEGMADPATLLATIRGAAPDVLFVALGDPRQAQWIVANRSAHGVPLVMGVGALFDFESGNVPRAPLWARRLRLEWAYRMSREPGRLGKRYTIDVLAFVVQCLRTHRAERLAREQR